MSHRPAPRLLAISSRRELEPGPDVASNPTRNFIDWLEAVATSPIDAVQIREKDLDDRDLLALTRDARRVLPRRVALLVNGRADIALAAGADGVHLPAAGVPAAALRRRLGQDLLIGVSTHSVEEVAAARTAGADYVTFGPVWATPSKESYGPPPGLFELERAAAVGLPVLALGGVTIRRAPRAAAAGAAGIAGIRIFLRPGDPGLKSAARVFEPNDR